MSAAPLVCLITPGHVASTPRLVKSADALAQAGYRVHVVAGAPFPPADRLDAAILSRAKWSYTGPARRGGAGVFTRKLLRQLARRLVVAPGLDTVRMAARAHMAQSTALAAAASRIPAQLYVGHCVAGLYAAWFAAQSNGRPYGFDIEDFHDAETQEAMDDGPERSARVILQRRLLPSCALLTCASPLIGRGYEEAYGVSPQTILNVFPLCDSPEAQRAAVAPSEARPARLYWFSQTIGPGRGLEGILLAMGRLRTPAELHLRGFVSPDYRDHLQSFARKAGVRRPVVFLEPGLPMEMARLASESDIGLSLEEPQPRNHDICLANKIFVYLLAGMPQLLSNTSAHVMLKRDLGDAALVCDLRQESDTAALLDTFLSDPERMSRARAAAWKLSHERFCWDVEKEVLLRMVEKVLPLPR